MHLFLPLVFLSLLTLSTLDLLRPGSAALDTSIITSRVDTLLILIPQDEQLYVGALLRLQTSLSEPDSDRRVTRVEQTFAPDGTLLHVDSFVVEQQTLAPLYQQSHGLESEEVTGSFDGRAFYANSMDLLLASLPLQEGYTTDLALVSPSTPEEQVAHLMVVGLGSVATMTGEACSVWEVKVDHPASGGTYWISHAERLLVRYIPDDQSMMIARKAGCPVGA